MANREAVLAEALIAFADECIQDQDARSIENLSGCLRVIAEHVEWCIAPMDAEDRGAAFTHLAQSYKQLRRLLTGSEEAPNPAPAADTNG